MDTWFVGYTRQLATAVWVGDPDIPKGKTQRSTLNGRTIGGVYKSSVFGATFAGPIWKDIMTTASKGMPLKQFDQPGAQYLVSPKKTVPDVRGKSPQEAKSILEAADFEVAVSGEQEPSSYPAGSVASTSPGGGSSAAIGSTITLTLSSGGGGGGPGNGDNDGDGNGGEIKLPGGGTIELPDGPGNGR